MHFKDKTQQHHPPYFLCLLPRLLPLSQVSIQEEVASHFIVFSPRYIPIFHPSQSSAALAYGTTKSVVLCSLYIRITRKDFKEMLTYGPHPIPNDSEFLEVGPGHLCLLICVKLTRWVDAQWGLGVTAFSNIYLDSLTWSTGWCGIYRGIKLTNQLAYSQYWWEMVHCSQYMWTV